VSFRSADAQNQPEEGYACAQEQQIHQHPVAHPPAGQSETSADQYVHQEEKHQQQVQLGMKASGGLKGKQGHIPPGISGDDEDYHEQEEKPGGYAVYLDQNSSHFQSSSPQA